MRHTVIRSLARTAPASTGVAPGQRLGSLIGGIFGLIYVGANAGSLPDPWAPVLPGFLLLTASYWAATHAAMSGTSTTKGHAGPACMGSSQKSAR